MTNIVVDEGLELLEDFSDGLAVIFENHKFITLDELEEYIYSAISEIGYEYEGVDIDDPDLHYDIAKEVFRCTFASDLPEDTNVTVYDDKVIFEY